jgi:hypothetical protein
MNNSLHSEGTARHKDEDVPRRHLSLLQFLQICGQTTELLRWMLVGVYVDFIHSAPRTIT